MTEDTERLDWVLKRLFNKIESAVIQEQKYCHECGHLLYRTRPCFSAEEVKLLQKLIRDCHEAAKDVKEIKVHEGVKEALENPEAYARRLIAERKKQTLS